MAYLCPCQRCGTPTVGVIREAGARIAACSRHQRRIPWRDVVVLALDSVEKAEVA